MCGLRSFFWTLYAFTPGLYYGHLILAAFAGDSVGKSRHAKSRFSSRDYTHSPSGELAATFHELDEGVWSILRVRPSP